MLTGNNPPPPHNHRGALRSQAARRTHRQHRHNGVHRNTPKASPQPPGQSNQPPELPNRTLTRANKPNTHHKFSSPTAERSSPDSCCSAGSALRQRDKTKLVAGGQHRMTGQHPHRVAKRSSMLVCRRGLIVEADELAAARKCITQLEAEQTLTRDTCELVRRAGDGAQHAGARSLKG